MRKITLNLGIIFTLLLGVGISGAYAQCTPLTLPYNEGFHSAPTLPSCARSVDGDGDGGTWGARDFSYTPGDNNPALATWNDNPGSDNWYYTPPLMLHQDSLYQLYFVVRGHGKGQVPLSLEVRWGADTSLPDSMYRNLPLYNNPSLLFQHPDFDTVIAYFKPSRTTRYYIGFHDNSNATNYEMIIDTMSVVKAESNSLNDVQMGIPLAPVSSQCPNDNDIIKVVVTNSGTFSVSNIPVTVSYSGTASGSWNDTIVGPLEAGESDTLTFSGIDFSAAGMYNFRAFTAMTGDDNRGNDTVRIPFEVKALPAADSITATLTSEATYIFNAVNATDVLNYEWDFGDGNSSTDDMATHTYLAAGTYTVTLVVSNKCGNETVTKTIEVEVDNDDDETGISNSYMNDMQVSIFPNPARDMVNVIAAGEIGGITVCDGVGRVVYHTGQVSGNHSIATGQWAQGLYIVSVHTQQGIAIRKLQLVK